MNKEDHAKLMIGDLFLAVAAKQADIDTANEAHAATLARVETALTVAETHEDLKADLRAILGGK